MCMQPILSVHLVDNSLVLFVHKITLQFERGREFIRLDTEVDGHDCVFLDLTSVGNHS